MNMYCILPQIGAKAVQESPQQTGRQVPCPCCPKQSDCAMNMNNRYVNTSKNWQLQQSAD